MKLANDVLPPIAGGEGRGGRCASMRAAHFYAAMSACFRCGSALLEQRGVNHDAVHRINSIRLMVAVRAVHMRVGAVALLLFHFAGQHVALHGRLVIDESFSIEVVDFMLQAHRNNTLGVDGL